MMGHSVALYSVKVYSGTTISPEAQGSIMVPGIWSDEQVQGWKKVTKTVHEAGGKIVAQLWHVGRMSHSTIQPDGGQPVSASATVVASPMNTTFAYLDDGTPGRVSVTPPVPLIPLKWQEWSKILEMQLSMPLMPALMV